MSAPALTRPRLTAVTTVDTVTDPRILAAFASQPHYRSVQGRSSVDGWDPLSTEGPHRATWRLTGYRHAGTADGRAIYVLRVAVNDTSRVEYTVAEMHADTGALIVIHAYDYQPHAERTRTGAEATAAKRLVALTAEQHALAAGDGHNGAPGQPGEPVVTVWISEHDEGFWVVNEAPDMEDNYQDSKAMGILPVDETFDGYCANYVRMQMPVSVLNSDTATRDAWINERA